jgi:hypothetical protein
MNDPLSISLPEPPRVDGDPDSYIDRVNAWMDQLEARCEAESSTRDSHEQTDDSP